MGLEELHLWRRKRREEEPLAEKELRARGVEIKEFEQLRPVHEDSEEATELWLETLGQYE